MRFFRLGFGYTDWIDSPKSEWISHILRFFSSIFCENCVRGDLRGLRNKINFSLVRYYSLSCFTYVLLPMSCKNGANAEKLAPDDLCCSRKRSSVKSYCKQSSHASLPNYMHILHIDPNCLIENESPLNGVDRRRYLMHLLRLESFMLPFRNIHASDKRKKCIRYMRNGLPQPYCL